MLLSKITNSAVKLFGIPSTCFLQLVHGFNKENNVLYYVVHSPGFVGSPNARKGRKPTKHRRPIILRVILPVQCFCVCNTFKLYLCRPNTLLLMIEMPNCCLFNITFIYFAICICILCDNWWEKTACSLP